MRWWMSGKPWVPLESYTKVNVDATVEALFETEAHSYGYLVVLE